MRYFGAAFLFLLVSSIAFAAVKFPPLSDRVVDDAHILSTETKNSLTNQLTEHERQTTEQIVVATVPSLQGEEIEPYANQLFRQWKLGQKDKNNGVLLLVAPNEREVRIEVGYGLEGKLTDAISSQIIHNIIMPEFKNGNMEKGITGGVDGIITVLSGGKIVTSLPTNNDENSDTPPWVIIALILFIVFVRWRFGIWFIPFGFGGRSGGDGGFSGGGGSSGGGGASGRW